MATRKTRRRAERSPIPVEVRSELEQGIAARLERWERAGRTLLAHDAVQQLDRALLLAETYISIYEHPEESEEVFHARLRRANGRSEVPS